MLNPILALIDLILGLYSTAVVIYIIVQLLCHFEIINKNQPLVAGVMGFLARIIEPVLARIRKILKPINGVDISPLILIITIYFVQYSIRYYFG